MARSLAPDGEAHATGFDNCESAEQARAQLRNGFDHGCRLGASRAIWKPQEEHARGRISGREDQSAKIEVFGNKDALLVDRTIENLLVGGPSGYFSDGNHVMASFTEGTDDRPGAAFVGQEVHA